MSISKSHDLTIKEISGQDIGLGLIMNDMMPIQASWRFGLWKEGSEAILKSANKRRDELLIRLAADPKARPLKVAPEKKQEFSSQDEALQAEKATISIPEIPISLIKDIPLSLRFTTLVGQWLKMDKPFTYVEYKDITVDSITAADIGLSTILDQPKMPTQLALKLGEAKRIVEGYSNDLRKFRSDKIKELGELNSEFDYAIIDQDKIDEFEKAMEEYKAKVVESFKLPPFSFSEFQSAGDKKDEMQFPSRFFTLFSKFIQES